MFQSDLQSENFWSIVLKFELTDIRQRICGGVLLTEIFGISAAHCMSKDSHDTMFESIAGEHDYTKNEVNEQS